jgi:hypothetical protein
MTIRFAGTHPALSARLSGYQARAAVGMPANDNAAAGLDGMLHAALRHFAEHGLAAAHCARRQAEAAFLTGDAQGYQWWLEICRALDRAMASELDARRPRRS